MREHDLSELSIPADEGRRPEVRRSSPLAWLLLVLVLAGAGGLGYWLHEQLELERAETESARKAARELAETLHHTQDAQRGLEAQVSKLQADAQGLTQQRDSLSQSVAQKDAELEELKGTYKTLEDKLQAEIKKGDVHLTEANGKIRVDLVDQILFDSGQASLSARGAEVLGRVGAVLTQIRDRKIQVSGHTDDSPISEKLASIYPTNWELSVARAVNVVRYLAEHAGVPAKRLVASGTGPYEPVASNATPQGRARNRRVEILLMPPLAESSMPALAVTAPAQRSVKKPATTPKRMAVVTASFHKPKRH